jgi:hypothetical protein
MGIADQSQSKEIDEHNYLVRPLGAFPAQRLLVRIGKIVAPMAGGFKGLDSEMDLGPAISRFFEAATPDEVEGIIKELAKNTEVDGKALSPVFDIHFRGKLLSMYKWAAFALEVNYSDFFGGLGGLASVVEMAKASLSKRPSTSSGPVGGSSQSA